MESICRVSISGWKRMFVRACLASIGDEEGEEGEEGGRYFEASLRTVIRTSPAFLYRTGL